MNERLRRIGSELLIFSAVVVFTFAARSAVADHYYIPSESMEHSLLAGDRVLVDKRAYGLRLPFTDIRIAGGRAPVAGEIVVFDSPESGIRLIKRIVAVGGDRVSVSDGRLTIDGRRLEGDGVPGLEVFGSRRVELNLDHGGGPDMAPTVVPEGMIMVMGDHRGNSRDSRVFGFVPVEAIYGRAFRLYFRSTEGLVWKPL